MKKLVIINIILISFACGLIVNTIVDAVMFHPYRNCVHGTSIDVCFKAEADANYYMDGNSSIQYIK